MTQLKQIIYASTQLTTYDEDKLLALLVLARDENKKHDVSGMLVFHDGCFLQVIEGPCKAIDQLFSNIKSDDTHTGVICLSDKLIEERDFPDWSMGFRNITVDPPEGFTAFLSYKGEDELAASRAKRFLLSFKVTHGLSFD